MSHSLENLLQCDVINEWLPQVGAKAWQTAYCSEGTAPASWGVWSALLTKEAARRAMARHEWDLYIGDGQPGCVRRQVKGKWRTQYMPHGTDDGVRPFVLLRQFDGAFPRYCEVIEEFRLFHNLSPSPSGSVLNGWDESGEAVEAVRISPDYVEVDLAYLRQFQAATQLYLAIYIDSFRCSPIDIGSIQEKDRKSEFRAEWMRVERTISPELPWRGGGSFSRVCGKAILPPPKRRVSLMITESATDAAGIVEFVVGVDADGNEVTESSASLQAMGECDAASIKPVFFRREVLAKYYEQPERYTVTDGRLQCLGLWSCPIDNDHESHVIVFLDDLCQRLPYKEKLHWRSHNVPPEGRISETAYRRNFLVEFIDATSADLVFRRHYEQLTEDWAARCGWSLFRSPEPGDSHLLKTVRVPATASQPEFDQQVLGLAKLLVDHLNERALEELAGTVDSNAKGIDKMEAFVTKTAFPNAKELVSFLRALQKLRSKGSAHRKGSEYPKALQALGLDPSDRRHAFRILLSKATSQLQKLRNFYLDQ